MGDVGDGLGAAFGDDVVEGGAFVVGGRAAEEGFVEEGDFLVGGGGFGQLPGEEGGGVGEAGGEGAIEESEGLGHGGVFAGVVDDFAVALAKGAKEVTGASGAGEFGGAGGDDVGGFCLFQGGAALFFGHAGEGGFVDLGTFDFGLFFGFVASNEIFGTIFADEVDEEVVGGLTAQFVGGVGEGFGIGIGGSAVFFVGRHLGAEVIEFFVVGLAVFHADFGGGDDAFGAFFFDGGEEHGEVVEVLVEALVVGVDGAVEVAVGEGDDAVPDLFGAHAAEHGAGEVGGFTESDFLGAGHALVGVRVVEDAKEGLEGVFFLDHELGEVVHESGVRGDGGVGHFIDGFDESEAEDFFPHAVGDDRGEAGVFGAGHPVGEGFDTGLAFFGFGFMAEEGACFDGVAWFGVVVFVVVGEFGEFAIVVGDGGVAERLHDILEGLADLFHFRGVDGWLFGFLADLGNFFGVLADVGLAFLWGHLGEELGEFGIVVWAFADFDLVGAAAFGIHAVGEGGHAVVVQLGPFIEGVIVALSADDAGAEEDLDGVGEVIEFVFVALVEADAAAVPSAAFGGEEFFDELVVRGVGLEFFLHPFLIGFGGDPAFDVVGEAEDIGPVVEEVAGIAVAGEEGVDEFGAFLGIVGSDEGVAFFEGGDAAGDVEVEAADEDVVGSGGIGLEAVFFPVGSEEGIDLSGLRQGGGVGGASAEEDEGERFHKRSYNRR